jgi:hypothetical protein
MGIPTRLLPIFAAAALLAFGAVACGGDDSDSPSTQAATADRALDQAGDTASDRDASDGKGKDRPKPNDREDNDAGDSGNSEFVPKEHDDSGGGSEQYRVKGGDNSVQEFGAEADDSEREEAAAALHNFLDARAAEDWESACLFLAEEIQSSLEELVAQSGQAEDAGCPEILAKLTNRAALPALRAEAARADVGSLRVEDDRAFIVYRGPDDTILAVPMASEDGSWKVASIAGTPLN